GAPFGEGAQGLAVGCFAAFPAAVGQPASVGVRGGVVEAGALRGWGGVGQGGGEELGGGGVAVGEASGQGAVLAPQVVQLVLRERVVVGGGAVGVEQREDRGGGLGQRGGGMGGGEFGELGLGGGQDLVGQRGDDGVEAAHGGADDL